MIVRGFGQKNIERVKREWEGVGGGREWEGVGGSGREWEERRRVRPKSQSLLRIKLQTKLLDHCNYDNTFAPEY